jgi:hypothetical protein
MQELIHEPRAIEHCRAEGIGMMHIACNAGVRTSGGQSAYMLNEKPDRSALTRLVVRLGFCVAEPNQAAAISASR